MKLKVGSWIIHEKALRKLALILFLIGIHIGVRMAAEDFYRRYSTVNFIILYAILIPRILRNIGDDIEQVN